MKISDFANSSFLLLFVLSPVPAWAEPGNGNADVIPGQFIIQLSDGVDPEDVIRDKKVSAKHVYRHAIRGFSAKLSDLDHGSLKDDSRVVNIEPDRRVSISTVQSPATWGLDRIDQRALPLDNSYSYVPTGFGVTAYVIDTGIRHDHSEFSGRVFKGTDTVGDGTNGEDCNGHGTHVAGTIGGSTYGVAKDVTLVSVRVLNCQGSGSWSGVIAGIDWVKANHVPNSVANMSLGGGKSSSVDTAVRNLINSGVATAVAAGNSNKDACGYSPARVPEAMTVGATTSTDARASYSNFGSCVDLLAPGSLITSAWNTDANATNTISGTSMATPHVAGVAALFLQLNPLSTAQFVRDAIVGNATLSKVTGLPAPRGKITATPNRLLFTFGL